MNIKSARQTVYDEVDLHRTKIVDDVFELLEHTIDKVEISRLIDIYWEESVFMLSLLEPYLSKFSKASRILEVGAGTGILSHILTNAGYHVCCIEPGANSFGFMPFLAKVITGTLKSSGIATAVIEDVRVEEYSAEKKFDFIFSAHVLEHISNKSQSFAILADLLQPSGLMVHLCPNYIIPYEPHIGKVLVPFLGAKNKYIYMKSYQKQKELWDGVNFISSIQVLRLARINHLEVTFRNDILGIYVERFIQASELRSRHDNWLFRLFVKSILLAGLRHIVPGYLQSPMLFELRKM